MLKLLTLTFAILVSLDFHLVAQVRELPSQEVMLSARDGKIVIVPPNSSNYLVSMIVDPSSTMRESFDIVSPEPGGIVTLLLPNGTEITPSNAASLGCDFITSVVPTGNEFQSLLPFFLQEHIL